MEETHVEMVALEEAHEEKVVRDPLGEEVENLGEDQEQEQLDKVEDLQNQDDYTYHCN